MRYHFHIRDQHGLIADIEGCELSGMDEVRAEARANAMELVIEDLRFGAKIQSRSIEIATPDGKVVHSLAVRDVLN